MTHARWGGWRRQAASGVVLAVAAVLATVWWLLPQGAAAMVCYEGTGFGAAIVIAVSAVVRRPARRWPWFALALACAFTAAGDLVWDVNDIVRGLPGYIPKVAAIAYLASYPAAVASVIGFLGPRSRRRDLTLLIDAALYATASWLVLWVVLVTPLLRDGGLTFWDWIPTVAYPPLDVIVLVALWRVGRGDLRRCVPWIALMVGFGATLVADTLYALFSMPDVGLLGRALDVLWLATYAFAAAAAAHPDMVLVDADPEPRWTHRRSQSRIVAIGVALAAPALLLAFIPDQVATEPVVVACAGLILVVGAVARFSSAIARHRDAERTLAWEATHDTLTGLLNRVALLEELDTARRRSSRSSMVVAVLYLDLDDFKVVNDSLGHAVGDELLVSVAGRITHAVREQDVVARLGGDEFVVVCDRLEDASVAEEVATRILRALEAPFDVSAKKLYVSASIGIVHAGGSAGDPGILLRNADLAMYLAKEQGRARIATFDAALHARAHDRLVTDIALRRAVADGQLLLEYQPIVSLDAASLPEGGSTPADLVDNVVAYEALVRWDRPGHGRVGPDAFIPLAEATGVILEIGAWVARRAARQWRTWHDAGVIGPDTRMSINVSPRQLRHADTGARLADLVRAEGVDPRVIQLEITESGLLDPTDMVTANLGELRRSGFRFAIDDFGTGYSSLAYLKRLDVSTIKIDRIFIDGLGRDCDDENLVRAIVTMAHQLGISTTAEGVERVEQLDALVRLGADAVQGYLTGRPSVGYASPAGRAADAPRVSSRS